MINPDVNSHPHLVGELTSFTPEMTLVSGKLDTLATMKALKKFRSGAAGMAAGWQRDDMGHGSTCHEWTGRTEMGLSENRVYSQL